VSCLVCRLQLMNNINRVFRDMASRGRPTEDPKRYWIGVRFAARDVQALKDYAGRRAIGLAEAVRLLVRLSLGVSEFPATRMPGKGRTRVNPKEGKR